MNGKFSPKLISLIPLVVLIGLLALCISIFGSDSILGASQVALLASSGVCIILGMTCFKTEWAAISETVSTDIKNVSSAILILFLIGAISGTWTMSGIIPTLIYYGVQIIHPKVFLLSACLICSIVSVMIGSSWTTIATIGVALLGIGQALGFSPGLTAGAIISGAYFGDKISPLSDTTVMASSVNGVPLFQHIRYMFYTTVPSILIALIIYLILGLGGDGVGASDISLYKETLGSKFHISPILLVVPLITVWMIYKRLPAIAVLGISSVLAAAAACLAQPGILREIALQTLPEGSPDGKLLFTGTVRSFYDSITLSTGIPEIDSLVSTRGMLGMLNTVYLIICAMCFGGCMKATGMIGIIADMIRPMAKSRTGLVSSTVLTGFFLNATVSDQYLSIIMDSDIYRELYRKKGFDPRLLSRSIEDSATVTSPLIPWSSCGMTQATILSVPTLVYAPYAFFCFISPLMSILVAALGWKISSRTPDTPGQTS